MASASAPACEKTLSRLLIDLDPKSARFAAGGQRHLPELEPFAQASAARRRLSCDLHADLVTQNVRRYFYGGARLLHYRHFLRDHARRGRDVMALADLSRLGQKNRRRHAVRALHALARFPGIVEANRQHQALVTDLQRVLRLRRSAERKRHYKADHGAAVHLSSSTRQAVLGLRAAP